MLTLISACQSLIKYLPNSIRKKGYIKTLKHEIKWDLIKIHIV